MSQKILLCRLIWAEKYDSKNEDMYPGNMRYPADHGFGGEQLNFAEEAGTVYGFVENRSQNLDIRKIGAPQGADSVDGVTVIFCAIDELSKRLRVVGWYENATAFKSLQKPKRGSIRGDWEYYFRTASQDAHLIPATSRDLELPRKQKITDTGFIGQRNVFYPAGNPNYERFLESFALLKQDVGRENLSEPNQRGISGGSAGLARDIILGT